MTVPRKYRKLFQDAIVVNIPLDVTADLGVAIKRTRAKRIQALYDHFPSLKKETVRQPNNTNNDTVVVQHDDDDDDDEDDEDEEQQQQQQQQQLPRSKQKPNLHQPIREQYASVLDYLEAKYVMGVTVPSSEGEDEHEDRGSVYSETSFLDDTQLKSELAEQVLSQITHAKVGAEENDDDDDDDEFFVNVGNLEVEEDGLMDYDPLEEEKVEKKEAKKRKRPDSTKSSSSVKSSKSTTKKPKTETPNKSVASKKKSTPKSAENAKEENDKELPEDPQENLAFLKQAALDKKEAVNELYDTIVKKIKAMTDEELPRRKKTSKVSLVVSEGKGPGDTIMFSNPHIPGQRLQVKVPKGMSAGGKFIVSVPAPAVSVDTDANINWTREFQELVADFSSTYDEWCQAEAEYRDLAPDIKEKFPLKKEKMNKFEKLVKEFPSDLVTPVDSDYLKSMARRARQNQRKRVKKTSVASPKTTVASPKTTMASPKKKEPKKETVPKETVPEMVDIEIPGKGRVFPNRHLKASEFEA